MVAYINAECNILRVEKKIRLEYNEVRVKRFFTPHFQETLME